jgi:hypothetical protein
MNKTWQDRLDKIPPEYEAIKPFIIAVMNKFGENVGAPYVAARIILIKMMNEIGEINEKVFWTRLEERLNEAPKKGGVHIFRFPKIAK